VPAMSGEVTPEIYMTQIPGIPGINGVDLFYGSWHLLNEALSCFINQEYFACLICLSTSVELWLKRTLSRDGKLDDLLKQAKTAKIIDNDEFEALNTLRKDRNAYVHFDLDKLPKSKGDKLKSVKIEPNWTDEEINKAHESNGIEVDVYATPAHKDMLPLGFVTVSSYFHLNYVTEFFLKRYPRNDSAIDSYYSFTLINVKGLDEKQVVFHLVPRKGAIMRGKSGINLIKYIPKSVGMK
jgi:hypothetical protein